MRALAPAPRKDRRPAQRPGVSLTLFVTRLAFSDIASHRRGNTPHPRLCHARGSELFTSHPRTLPPPNLHLHLPHLHTSAFILGFCFSLLSLSRSFFSFSFRLCWEEEEEEREKIRLHPPPPHPPTHVVHETLAQSTHLFFEALLRGLGSGFLISSFNLL